MDPSSYPLFAGKAVRPQIFCLGRDIGIPPGGEVELACPKATILNIAFRIRSSGPVGLAVEEHTEDSWLVTETLEAGEGETVWHHILKKPAFRLRLGNPARDREVKVTVDVNLPSFFQPAE
ncbi:MAG: hypothetical protein ACPLQO_00775 [Desulfotomaculales bacterium]